MNQKTMRDNWQFYVMVILEGLVLFFGESRLRKAGAPSVRIVVENTGDAHSR